ncbi:MAG TPA: hypothetical protein VGD42_17440 [Lysobacter sp.]
MTDNPYAAPIAPVGGVPPLVVPEAVLKKIRNAWVAAVVSGGVTLVVTLVAISGTSILGFTAWELLDVALVFGLAFGIYKKSRICAVLMLGYFVMAKIFIMIEAGAPRGLLLAIVFAYFFFQGAAGTFEYHKLRRAAGH